jgi:hypothetical protein
MSDEAYNAGYECGRNDTGMLNPYEPDEPEFECWEEGKQQGIVDREAETEEESTVT